MEYLPLIIQLLSGAAGGNLAGKLMPKFSMGTLGNSLVGILGGGIGGQLLGSLGMATSGGMDLMGIIGSITGGGVGGGVLMAIIGLIRSLLTNKS
ncbi:MAG: hypothetical protein IPL08_04180 [Saprospiraceae bacterium]|nr:hypothetical protein [Saprospiraceae bacterium]